MQVVVAITRRGGSVVTVEIQITTVPRLYLLSAKCFPPCFTNYLHNQNISGQSFRQNRFVQEPPMPERDVHGLYTSGLGVGAMRSLEGGNICRNR